MNLTQAEAIASLYQELINAIPRELIPQPPEQSRFYKGELSIDEITLEDGQVKVKWSKYIGCGDYEKATTYHNLNELFD